jgi:hypothetical protein
MKGPGAGQNMADKNFNGVQEFAFSQKNVSSQVRGQLFKWYFQFHLSHIFTQECSSLTTFFNLSLNFICLRIVVFAVFLPYLQYCLLK